MTETEFGALLGPLSTALSEAHGDHEGGWPGNCHLCAIAALVETIMLLAANANWDS